MRRRHPACGAELEHGPHEFATDLNWDGTELGPRPEPSFCAGWTAVEADLCSMLRKVHLAMLEKAKPGLRYRLEISAMTSAVLSGLFLTDLEDMNAGRYRVSSVHGAELATVLTPDPQAWQLVEVGPPLAKGITRV